MVPLQNPDALTVVLGLPERDPTLRSDCGSLWPKSPESALSVLGVFRILNSPLFVHLNAGKRLVSDLPLEGALPWADVVLESRVAHELADTPAAPEALAANGPVLITSSPWGYASSRPDRVLDELLVPEPERLRQFYLDVGRGKKP